MTTQDYIIPTKQRPVFQAHNDYLGYITWVNWKRWFIPELNTCGDTFAVNYAGAVEDLHKWIQDNPEFINEYPKSKFTIEAIDGSLRRDKDYASFKVYEITASKAKKYLL